MQPLRPCELQREKAFQGGESYVPQCLEDGQFRKVQCDNNGLSCWCVDDKGIEVPGSKRTGSAISCLSFCQLQKQQILVSRYINSSTISSLPQCLDSGDFDPVQCDMDFGQCWCMDAEGMEIYGTRQRGKPVQCPGKCEIRDRRILHGAGEKSPPQCSSDGEFLRVQCKFVNTTDRMVFDLLHNFNRFPKQFQTFSSFRRSFPEVSGYCYCADSLGREIEETGLEMLLENVYDTVFALLEPAHTFTDTTMYRILQRRFLGIQLATSGRFRCPSRCELERSTAIHFKHHYRPVCDDTGAYKPTQCQLDGQCWCVDSKGQELVGTRRQGQLPACGEEHACVSERQRSLSRLFHGPVGHFSQHSLFSASQQMQKATRFSNSCPSFKELFVDSDVLSPILEKASASYLLTLESVLSEAIRGMFPSRELARIALQFTSSSKQFQENLFGGTFLKNLIQFNFTGAIGTSGKFNLDQYFQQVGLTGGFAELAQQSLDLPKMFNLSQHFEDSFGRNVNLQDNQNTVRFLASVLETPEFFSFLGQLVSIPVSVSEDLGDIARIVLKAKDCQEQDKDFFVPSCTKDGRYQEMQCYAGDCWCVDQRGKEIPGSRVRGTQPRCPTTCEKQRESLQQLKRSQPAGSELFVPSCTQEGKFLPVQCHGINCFCVNLEGRAIPGISANPEQPVQCPSDCQLAGGQAFLRTVQELLVDPAALPQLSSVYIPQCSLDGQWRQVQCNGPPEQAFEWYQRWITHNNNGKALPFTDMMNILLDYKEGSRQSFEVFVKILYEAGHQNVFPEFSKYPSFDAVPQDVLVGNTPGGSPENVLLEPFTFWQLLHGHLIHYLGSYGDFSAPLRHFDLRNCWCVDEKGQIQGSEAEVNKSPDCPRPCDVAKQEAMQFVSEVEELIRASNGSHFPFGQSFLMAKGVLLTDDELLNFSQLGTVVSEKLLTGSNYAIQLAAQSTLHFYWRNLFASRDSAGEAVRLAFQPYIPQCDGLGNWSPVQSDVMSALSDQRTDFQLEKEWLDTKRDFAGTYSVLQRSDTQAWCVDPVSGEVLQQSSIDSDGRAHCPGYCNMLKSRTLLRETGQGYVPQCESDSGTFSPMQCDEAQESCWCVFANGEEAPGTRVRGKRPACARPQCHLPFDTPDVLSGGIFCNNDSSPETQKTQRCKVICASGFHYAVSREEMLLCDTERGLWLGEPPHPQTCQKLQSFQSVNTQTHFQLLLPPEKACSPDYSGLLEAFQIFILDEMNARGFCHIQGNAFGYLESAPVCGESAVHVECLAADRLGVNITWTALLEDVPAASFPDLHSIEKAMVGEDLIGRFEALIRSGDFVLRLDSKQFQADTSIHFLRDANFNVSPGVYLGCRNGFRKVSVAGGTTPNLQGCGVTDCQMNEQGTRCDINGRYRPSYENSTTKRWFCVDNSGKILDWTETDGPLTDSQCLALGRFERVSPSKLSFTTEEIETVGSKTIQGEPGFVLQQCIAGQEFTTAGVKTFEVTAFQDVVSGVYQNLILSAAGTSLTDVHLFCRQACGQEACCDGFILSQIILDGGSILCGLMSYPDVLICNTKDWDRTSTSGRRDACQKVNYKEENKQYTFHLGGQVLTGNSDMMTRIRSSACDVIVASTQTQPLLPDSAMELFSLWESSQVLVDQNSSLPSEESWLFKHRYSAEQAFLWCLARCVEEEFCQLVDIPDVTTTTYFPCTLYPVAQICDNIIDNIPEKCTVVLPQEPRRLYQKTVIAIGFAVFLEGSVKNFYTRVPFRKISRTSVRNKVDMSGKTVSNGFFDCERLCDADPCCTGFEFVNASQATGDKIWCLILNSLGIQTCSEELRNDWQVSNCASLELGARIHPFGWYQKAGSIPGVCPLVLLPEMQENVTLDKWQRVDLTSVLIDASVSKFDILHVSRDVSSDFPAVRDFCLSVCSKDKFCLVTTLERQPLATRCMFYPETQSCVLDLQGHHCRLLLKEPATHVYRRQGKAYHCTYRASCWQPGDGETSSSSVSEDCLYLNIYVPENTGGDLPVLVFFHNGMSGDVDQPRTIIDGSFLAAAGNVIVVTASYRVGVFGFFSTGSSVANGNWGLLDQEAALKWIQKNIASFGGDPGEVTIAADRKGADVASIHLMAGTTDSGLFKRAVLMVSPISSIGAHQHWFQSGITTPSVLLL
ncbi:hypothetical protein lerEdw1_010718 [Lerista edwardsae]|nr:hypothetical protein lerEdw1_010718 [Lerista edwardsae]